MSLHRALGISLLLLSTHPQYPTQRHTYKQTLNYDTLGFGNMTGARDATPPPPAPLAHRPPTSTQHTSLQTTTSPSTSVNNVKSFATAAAVAAVGAHNRNHPNSHTSPLRLSPGPETPSITSGGAGGSSSSNSSCSSSGVGSLVGKMPNISVNQQQIKMAGPSADLNLHELGEALDHGSRMRKASSMPPQAAIGANQSPLSHSPPVWVPR